MHSLVIFCCIGSKVKMDNRGWLVIRRDEGGAENISLLELKLSK